MDIINANSTARLVLDFIQPGGAPAIVESVHYRIEDRTPTKTGETLRTATIGGGATVEIALTTADNAITASGENARRLIYRATYNSGADQITGQVDWQVRRLSTLP
jgi:hypothetical protein